MNTIKCKRCDLTVNVQHKGGDKFSYDVTRKELSQCAVLREKVADKGEADIRFLCPELEKSIGEAQKTGKLSRLN